MAPCRIHVTEPSGSDCMLTNIVEEGGTPWLLLAIDLGQHWSDTTRASPNSRLDDGVAELQIVPAGLSRQQLLKAYSLLATGAHAKDPEGLVQTVSFTKISISFPMGVTPEDSQILRPGIFNVDGEVFCHDGVVQLRVLPRRLRIFCDPDEECAIADHQTSASPVDARRREESVQYQVYPWRWLNMVLFFVCAATNQVIWITFAPIATTTSDAFDVSSTFVNALSLVFMALYIPCTLPASQCIDRLGCRPALLIGALLTAAGAALRAAASGAMVGKDTEAVRLYAWLVLLGQCLAAVGQPFLTNMPPKLANVWFPTHQRATADTICSMASPVGAAVGFLLPTAIVDGRTNEMTKLLAVEAGLAVAAFLLAVPTFANVPPTPPSASALADVVRNGGYSATPADRGGRQELSHTDACATVNTHGEARKGVFAESWEALCDRDFRAVQGAFAFGLGTFNTLGTMIQQLVTPFGFSENDASNFGALTIIMGLVGAAVCSTVLGYTHNYRKTLFACFIGATAGALGWALVLPWSQGGPAGWSSAAAYLSVAVLGFTMTPVMPVAFEASVELMHPAVGEAVLSGLCMVGGQVVGMAMTLVLQALLQAGYPKGALWVVVVGIAMGSVAIFFLRSASMGARRRSQEALQRRNTRDALRLAA